MTFDANVDYDGPSAVIRLITRFYEGAKRRYDPVGLFLLWRFTTRAFNGTKWKARL